MEYVQDSTRCSQPIFVLLRPLQYNRHAKPLYTPSSLLIVLFLFCFPLFCLSRPLPYAKLYTTNNLYNPYLTPTPDSSFHFLSHYPYITPILYTCFPSFLFLLKRAVLAQVGGGGFAFTRLDCSNKDRFCRKPQVSRLRVDGLGSLNPKNPEP